MTGHSDWTEQTYARIRAEVLGEQQGTEYVYTDPVTDPSWTRITEADDDNPVDVFPPTWGDAGPTERDQAAIDAGNA